MAFNWAGAAVGLLGGVEKEAKAHEKRLQDLEDQRIADRDGRRRAVPVAIGNGRGQADQR